ncbi:MAG: outer membrane lipoprotein-sorting protein [Gammaproteobacteria bacterium MedPE]|nr:MAG: outer membrane lipoprotein-sorting protein [Gammaproteobacteria bacterium MedPE]
MKKLTLITAMTLALSAQANAAVTSEEAAKLKKELTPVGATRAGNADGSIPAWTGGITKPVAGYSKGDHHPDPFAADKVSFTITASNLDQYKDNLTPGQVKLFETYPDTFKMHVYPTRRSASMPQSVYDAIADNATKAELILGGNGISNAVLGVPFPIPTTGLEVIWNHITRYRGEKAEIVSSQVAPTASGDFTMMEMKNSILFKYTEPGMTAEKLADDNIVFKFKQVTTQPARLAGTALLVHETLNQDSEPRKAWTYNTGQRRVRLAPNIAFDTPGTATDGLRTTDDFDMYNGSPSRYNWKLIGKKEIYIPYNSYKLHAKGLDYDDLIKPGHINQDYVRYEKHRVWQVEATLKEGMRHTYKKRVFFIDEDNWQVSVADIYDNRDELYRVAMAHELNYYELPASWSTLDVYYDLQARRYLAQGLDNHSKMYNFDAKLSDKKFTKSALRRAGR